LNNELTDRLPAHKTLNCSTAFNLNNFYFNNKLQVEPAQPHLNRRGRAKKKKKKRVTARHHIFFFKFPALRSKTITGK